jgi:hypothetical protein
LILKILCRRHGWKKLYIVVSSRKIIFFNSEVDRQNSDPSLILDLSKVAGLVSYYAFAMPNSLTLSHIPIRPNLFFCIKIPIPLELVPGATVVKWKLFNKTSVADPDPPDPHVFGPPGSGSGFISQRGSFYH